MRTRILWMDTETTGTLPWKHDIVKLACLVEEEHTVLDGLSLSMAPIAWDAIDPKALQVNRLTMDDLRGFPSAAESIAELIEFMSKYVDRYDRNDKFVLAGYNIGFDSDFLRSTFRKVGEGYFGSWFAWPTIDVAHHVALAYLQGLRLPDFKLSTICAHYDIAIDAHTATGDVMAARQLYHELHYMLHGQRDKNDKEKEVDPDDIPF
jgi:DNA polymerase III epsilon subunit-like protein